ncbi:MAG TPA: hypothetical protein VF942_12145, partial [Acidimicrobiales bacterium]
FVQSSARQIRASLYQGRHHPTGRPARLYLTGQREDLWALLRSAVANSLTARRPSVGELGTGTHEAARLFADTPSGKWSLATCESYDNGVLYLKYSLELSATTS